MKVTGQTPARPRLVPSRAWAVLGLTLVALPTLGWLQFSLTEEASQAEAYQMRQRLVAAGAQANSTLELERLVLREYVHDLRLPRRSLGVSPRAAVSGALEFWKERTVAPRILKGIWLVQTKGAEFLDAKTGQWTASPAPLPPAVRDLSQALTSGQEPEPELFVRGFFPSEPVSFSPALVMIPEPDLDAVISELIPAVLSEAFGGERGMADLSLTVRDTISGQIVYQKGPVPDPTVKPDLVQSLWNVGGGPPATRERPNSPLIRLWLHQTVDNEARWTLEVRPVNGTIDQVYSRIRWTNLGVSLTLLVVLGAGVLLLFGLYSRSRKMVRTQNAFVATVSHELRTPLAVVRAAAENLKEGLVTAPDQAVRYGTRILDESNRLLEMTENVLWYSGLGAQRVTIGDVENHGATVDVGALVGQTAAVWDESFQRAGAQLEVVVGPGSLEVTGDRSALKTIVDNLLSNALKYASGTKGHVVVAVGTAEGWVRIEVKDKGPGIPPRERRRVFEPFYQRAGSTGGIGLGLSLVRRIALAHGGDARVVGQPGWGTVVQVDLPPGALV